MGGKLHVKRSKGCQSRTRFVQNVAVKKTRYIHLPVSTRMPSALVCPCRWGAHHVYPIFSLDHLRGEIKPYDHVSLYASWLEPWFLQTLEAGELVNYSQPVLQLGNNNTHVRLSHLSHIYFLHLPVSHQSFQFMVDASEYQNSVHAVYHGSAESKDDSHFGSFTTIIDEYIKDRSNSEVNISSSSKQQVMALCDRAKYVALDKVSA